MVEWSVDIKICGNCLKLTSSFGRINVTVLEKEIKSEMNVATKMNEAMVAFYTTTTVPTAF